MAKNLEKIDIMDIRMAVKIGIFKAFVKDNTIYLKDTKSGESVKIGEIRKEIVDNDQEMVP